MDLNTASTNFKFGLIYIAVEIDKGDDDLFRSPSNFEVAQTVDGDFQHPIRLIVVPINAGASGWSEYRYAAILPAELLVVDTSWFCVTV